MTLIEEYRAAEALAQQLKIKVLTTLPTWELKALGGFRWQAIQQYKAERHVRVDRAQEAVVSYTASVENASNKE